MRILFILLIIIHALIHLLGFVKAFGLADVKQLTIPISKSFGVIWLTACVLFLATAILYMTKYQYWWVVGFIAILISQILIIYYWQDAKFGTIANVILLFACFIGFSNWDYYSKYKRDVNASLQLNKNLQQTVLTESDIQHLPEPVKKYLRLTGSIGKPKVNNFKIEFIGKLRKDEKSAWMPFTSEQYNFLETPTRLFFMMAKMKGMPVAGYHCYKNGRAFMDIRLFSLFKVQYQDGEEMDVSETVTFFNDMCCMAPPTLIDKRIKWLEVEENKVKASFTLKAISVTAWLYFNEKGELINFISNDRYSAEAGKKLPWSTPLRDYQKINGYLLAGNAETIYSYADRDLCYGLFKLKKVEYNCEIDK